MPFSQSSQLSTIVGYIEALAPSSILDVGIGMGQYGFLARTNLENINLFEIDGVKAHQKGKEGWKVKIDGVEGCSIYQTPVHDYVYNKIYWDDALKVLPSLPDNSYEFVMAIDILEHFEKEDGVFFLSELKRIATGSVLISTPKTFIPQEVEANPYENHRSFWELKDMLDAGYGKQLDNSESLIVVHELGI